MSNDVLAADRLRFYAPGEGGEAYLAAKEGVVIGVKDNLYASVPINHRHSTAYDGRPNWR